MTDDLFPQLQALNAARQALHECVAGIGSKRLSRAVEGLERDVGALAENFELVTRRYGQEDFSRALYQSAFATRKVQQAACFDRDDPVPWYKPFEELRWRKKVMSSFKYHYGRVDAELAGCAADITKKRVDIMSGLCDVGLSVCLKRS